MSNNNEQSHIITVKIEVPVTVTKEHLHEALCQILHEGDTRYVIDDVEHALEVVNIVID